MGFEDLGRFIANPKGYVPGTKMAYAGERDPGKEADIIAYLRTLSDSPVPLPQAADASAATGDKPAGDKPAGDKPAAPAAKPAGLRKSNIDSPCNFAGRWLIFCRSRGHAVMSLKAGDFLDRAVPRSRSASRSRRARLASVGTILPPAGYAATVPGKAVHGLSTFGDLAESPDFKAFGYVRPDAPKGGAISQEIAGSTFNTLNGFILRGDPAFGLGLIFDSLMTSSLDERGALYGLVAKSVSVSADGGELRFALRPEAKFHDGSPLTAKDVVFSLTTLKAKGHPTIRAELRDMESVAAEGPDVVVRLAPTRSREAALVVARQPIFSAAYYATKPFEESTLDPPLGSGAYRIGRFPSPGRFITYDRAEITGAPNCR